MPKKLMKSIGYGMAIFIIAVAWLAFGNEIVKITGFTVGVVAGTTYEEKAQQFNRVKKVKLYHDELQILRELETGTVEVGIMDRLVGLSKISNNGYHNLKPAGGILNRKTIGVAFHQEDKALRRAFNRGLQEIIANGVYAKISRKYFGCNILKGVDYHPVYPNEPPAADGSWNRVKQAGRIVFSMISDYPPFAYFNEQGEFTGFDVEVARAVCNQLGLGYVPVIIEWDQAFAGLKTKNYDGAWGSLLMKDEPEQVDYSNPCYLTGMQLFVRKDSPVTGPEILEGTWKAPLSFPLDFKLPAFFYF
jgi:ABC-type amino acid transport substrate-binding protein